MTTFPQLVLSGLRAFDPETAHRITIQALKRGFGGASRFEDDRVLRTTVWGLDFPNPIGLAAGFDKNAEVFDAMLKLGFGFVEAGTVTPMPQDGNPRPRVFRLPEDRSAINRLGFNNRGLARYAARLARHRKGAGIVGANVGKNKDTVDAAADYAIGIEAVARFADYLVVNISSPNTPGLRDLQERAHLEALIDAVHLARRRAIPDGAMPPLLVKIAPDLTQVQMLDIAATTLAKGVDGLIVGNTTISRPGGLAGPHRAQSGGLSGKALMPLSTKMLAEMYRLTKGQVPLIGCGGVASGDDAYAKIRAGASLVQLYTALTFRGPELIEDIKRDLANRLRSDGFRRVADAVGVDAGRGE